MEKITLRIAIGVLLLGYVLLGLASFEEFDWDGSFPAAEIRINLVDSEDKPIRDTSLKIFRSNGQLSYCYPISEFTEEAPLNSDDNGMYVVHQVNDSGLQFGGHFYKLFGFIEIGETEVPQFDLVFYKNNSPIHSLKFTDLIVKAFDDNPRKVKRLVCSDDNLVLEKKDLDKRGPEIKNWAEIEFIVIEHTIKISK